MHTLSVEEEDREDHCVHVAVFHTLRKRIQFIIHIHCS